MTCDLTNSELDNYLDGQVTAEIRWELEAHCRYCKPCQAALKSARQLQSMLAAYPVNGPKRDRETPGLAR